MVLNSGRTLFTDVPSYNVNVTSGSFASPFVLSFAVDELGCQSSPSVSSSNGTWPSSLSGSFGQAGNLSLCVNNTLVPAAALSAANTVWASPMVYGT